MSPLTVTTARISWTLPTGYAAATYSTLVFVKPLDPVNIGTPTKVANAYTSNVNIANGSVYQNDALAHCVFRGDGTQVNISGLVSGKLYHAVIFIVRDADSTYSVETLVSGYSLGAPPVYAIGQVNYNNSATGVADSLNVRATLRGIVYGVNLRTSPGVQFFIKDQTGGILVNNTTKDFGYVVMEGDSVEVQGTISQSRGWTFIGTLDTIIHLGSGKPLALPIPLNSLSEFSENNLIKISDLNFFTPLTVWPNAANAIVYAHRTGSTDTVNIRVYPNTTVAGSPTPTGIFSVIGMGGQVSTSTKSPFAFDGYSIIPSKKEDIIPFIDTLLPFNLIIPLDYMTVKLNGDTTQSLSIVFNKAVALNGFAPANYHFLLDYSGSGFYKPLFDIPLNGGSGDTTAEISYTYLASLFPFVKPGDSILLSWTINAVTGGYHRFANQFRTITLRRGTFTGISAVELNNSVVLSPNPASDAFVIQSPVEPGLVQILDLSGKLIQSYNGESAYKVDHLPKGLYFVKMKFGDQLITKKLVLAN